MNKMKIPVATIDYCSFDENLKIKTKSISINRVKPKFIINVQKKIFFEKNKITKINLCKIVMESKKIIKRNKNNLFLEINAKIIIYYLDEYSKNNILIEKIIIHKFINYEQKISNLKPFLKIKKLNVLNKPYLIADILLYFL